MARLTLFALAPLLLASGPWAGACAAQIPPDAVSEVRSAAHELAQAALLRYVARDRVEARHLEAARDLLAEAEPDLAPGLRRRVQRLEWDIGQDVGASAQAVPAPPLDALGPVSVLPALDRSGLGRLAQRAQSLARLATGRSDTAHEPTRTHVARNAGSHG